MAIGSPQRTTRFSAGQGAAIEDIHAMRDRLQALATDWPGFQKCSFAYDPDGNGSELPSDNGTLIAQKAYVIGNGCKIVQTGTFATSITSGFIGVWTGAAATPATIATPRMRWTQVEGTQLLTTHVAPSAGMFRWDLVQVRIDEISEAVEARAFQDAVDGPFTSQDLVPGTSSVCEIVVRQGSETALLNADPVVAPDAGCRALAIIGLDSSSGIMEIRDLTIPFGDTYRVRQFATEGWFQLDGATVNPTVYVPSNLYAGTDPVYYPAPPGLRDPNALLAGVLIKGSTGIAPGMICEIGRLQASLGWEKIADLTIVAGSGAYYNAVAGSSRIPCWGNGTPSRAFFGNPSGDDGVLAVRVATLSGFAQLSLVSWQFKK